MELTTLVAILILVWYYGHSLKVASEVDARVKAALLTELAGIKDSVAHVAKSISDLERRVAEIDTYAHSADVEWKYFNKQKIDPMLEELYEIGRFPSLSIAFATHLGLLRMRFLGSLLIQRLHGQKMKPKCQE